MSANRAFDNDIKPILAIVDQDNIKREFHDHFVQIFGHSIKVRNQSATSLESGSIKGVGFGNAGVHLCHGLSYPISSQGKLYFDKVYPDTKPLIPHGLSVVTTAIADFEFLASSCPERHAQAARQLGADIPENSSTSYTVSKLCDEIRGFMQDFGVPNGLEALGFQFSDIDKLSTAAVNSVVNIAIAPKPTDRELISKIYEKSLKVY